MISLRTATMLSIACVVILMPRIAFSDHAAVNQVSAPQIVYKPPAGAITGTRVDGTSRGVQDGQPISLTVLVPDHVARTTRDCPAVCWYLSRPVEGKDIAFDLTITKKKAPEPLLRVPLDPTQAGVRWLDLSDQKVKLDPDVEYRITVALHLDPKHPARDVTSICTVMRVAPPPELISDLRLRVAPLDRAIVYAKQGIWCDAMSLLSAQIDAEPRQAAVFLERRADLLQQVGLPKAAVDCDRDMARARKRDVADASKASP